MSRENVELVRGWVDAFNARDSEDIVERIDPDFEFRSIFVAVESVFRAPEGFPYEYFKAVDEAYESFSVAPSEFIDAGAAVLLFATLNWRGTTSGVEGQTPIATAFWLRGGKVFRAETFTDRTEALQAVGLRE